MAEKKENPLQNLLLNIVLNIVIPTVILVKFSGESALGVRNGIIVALAFPIGYGLYDLAKQRKFNFFSALGIINVLLTGGISLLGLDPKYLAIKEATIPGMIGTACLISLLTPYPLVKTLLFNKTIMQVENVTESLKSLGQEAAFHKALRNASLMVAGSFYLASTLNYILARYIVVSPPGTEAFNAELGKMTALSYPVIAVPSLLVLMLTLYYLYRSITKLTQLPLEEIFVDPEADKKDVQKTSE